MGNFVYVVSCRGELVRKVGVGEGRERVRMAYVGENGMVIFCCGAVVYIYNSERLASRK